ncbi:MAG: glycosyl hydrolase [Actinomycetales bacterium]|nr:glycosyl hydrolase [Actinomycetales bacterium]
MRIDDTVTAVDLLPRIDRLWQLSGQKIDSVEATCTPSRPSPVFTVRGRYTARGWTDWTRGFQYGSALLHYDATGDERYLRIGRDRTVETMAGHVSHVGVHDHGFNNISTYGTLWRLMNEERLPENPWEREFYQLALRVSGAVQAARWRTTAEGTGYVYSFNGPQSLFVDTVRSCRSLSVAHLLGHVLMAERETRVSLLGRMVEHATSTARWNIYYGEGRDDFDVRGRTAHESIFNVVDGSYRCPSTQQGFSPFSTWTRGLAWAMLGFAEQLEFIDLITDEELEPLGGRSTITATMLRAARATCDFYLDTTPADGVPYWDTGAPGLVELDLDEPADPFNPHEPVDSSAALIAAQGLLRLGHYLRSRNDRPGGGGDAAADRYWQAGLTVCGTVLAEPYLATDPDHQGLVLHSVYHRPNGWDQVRPGQRVPNGESSMWGDYHAREVALYLQRIATSQPYLTFFGPATAGGRPR